MTLKYKYLPDTNVVIKILSSGRKNRKALTSGLGISLCRISACSPCLLIPLKFGSLILFHFLMYVVQ